jgi:hypothetical protein
LCLKCTDPDAVLDDKSGRNFYPMQCQGTKVGTVDGNGTFTAATPSTVFPKCLSKCSVFFIGDKFVPVNTTVEVRAGQSLEFQCPDYNYIANQVSTFLVSLIK